MKSTAKVRFCQGAAAALSVGLVSTMAAGPLPVAQAAALSTDNVVTAAATKASMGMPEILGISGLEESNFSAVDGTPVADGIGGWTSPKYMLYGSSYNSNPNPFFANTISGEGEGVVFNKRSVTAAGALPALSAYGLSENDDAVWNRLPDIILGTANDALNNSVDYDTPEYAQAAAAAVGATGYHPISFNVKITTYSDFVDDMYELAEAGESVVAKSDGTKKLRYGSATQIAKTYEAYVKGTQGYILSCLKRDRAQKKTYAIVSSYDPASETYTLIGSSDKWGGDAAKQNRYYETMYQVGVNLSDALSGPTVTKEQLAQADLIVLAGEKTAAGTFKAGDIMQTLSSAMQKKTYYVSDSNLGAGATMLLTKNSPDNAQNMGRVLGCLYPEYIDQDDWVAFYYNKLYHIANGKVSEVIDYAMDGVTNWDATISDRLQWTAADASTYNAKSVKAKLDLGVAYIASLGSKAPAELKLAADSNQKSYLSYTSADYKKMLAADSSTKVYAATSSGKLASTKSFSAKIAGAKPGTYKLALNDKVTKRNSRYFSIGNNGKISVKKGLKKGTYKVRFKVSVKSSSRYKTVANVYTVRIV